METAEQVLVEYYDADTVEFHLNRMWAVEAFRDRTRFVRKALDDYRKGRFYASVPLVLAVLSKHVVHGEFRETLLRRLALDASVRPSAIVVAEEG